MKLYEILVLLLIMAAALLALGKAESQKCGPYLVTFNLTAAEKMNISQMRPAYYGDNVLYSLRFSNQKGDECGLIGICTFYQPASPYISLDNLASFVEATYRNMTYSHVTGSQRSIDGRSGFIVEGIDSLGHLNWIAGYWMIDGGTEVEIQGSREWEMRDVESMLNSVHVERVGF